MTAPVASGGSEFAGWGFTHWKAPPLHGARREQTFKKFELKAAHTSKADALNGGNRADLSADNEPQSGKTLRANSSLGSASLAGL
jgi:hypothetical protein